MTDVVEQSLFVPGAPAPLVYTLEQVEALTGWKVRSLKDDCIYGRIEHVNRKGTYGMTRAQIEQLAAAYTREATKPATAAEEKRLADEKTLQQMRNNKRTRGRSRTQRVAA